MKRVVLISTLLITLGLSLQACSQAAPAAQTPSVSATKTTSAATAVTLPTVVLPTTVPELSLGISGSGEVKAAQDADLVFIVQGTVAEVLVKEGETVKKDAVLARLDTRSFDQQIQQAEAQVALAQAQESALTEGARALDIAAAKAQVAQAQAGLTAVQQGPKKQDIEQAQAALDAAQINLQATRDRLSFTKTQSELQMQQATETLTQAQARFSQASYNWQTAKETGNDPVVPEVTSSTGKKAENKLSDGQLENYYAQYVQAEAALRQAEKSVELARVAYESARQAEVTGIQAAEQQVRQAGLALDKIKLPADKDKVAAAQAALAQARAAQDRLNPNPRESQKAQVSAGIAQAQAALELARINRERAEIRAPFDGVAAIVNISPGDPSSTGTQAAIRIVDISNLHVDVQISDVDIGKVSSGQPAEVRVDALPDKVFKGRVGYISPTATSLGTIRTFLVRIELDEQEGLRAGMSARVDILDK